ncbi:MULTISPECIES: hypothetical protein [unclassified Arthrobacter]|nr:MULTISPECIES: hypothetical protein [unclassified Arthrobacter]
MRECPDPNSIGEHLLARQASGALRRRPQDAYRWIGARVGCIT